MVVGPSSSGKTSTVKALTNMALGTGMGWTPCIVGLDPASVSLLFPSLPSISKGTQADDHSSR
jgi:polyribonucleotide 5'-hydroxyl-kinase